TRATGFIGSTVVPQAPVAWLKVRVTARNDARAKQCMSIFEKTNSKEKFGGFHRYRRYSMRCLRRCDDVCPSALLASFRN
ncbi:hypothetical protein K437DRAFT_223121, partial [Tilletiaria anomala UBC 951]